MDSVRHRHDPTHEQQFMPAGTHSSSSNDSVIIRLKKRPYFDTAQGVLDILGSETMLLHCTALHCIHGIQRVAIMIPIYRGNASRVDLACSRSLHVSWRSAYTTIRTASSPCGRRRSNFPSFGKHFPRARETCLPHESSPTATRKHMHMTHKLPHMPKVYTPVTTPRLRGATIDFKS